MPPPGCIAPLPVRHTPVAALVDPGVPLPSDPSTLCLAPLAPCDVGRGKGGRALDPSVRVCDRAPAVEWPTQGLTPLVVSLLTRSMGMEDGAGAQPSSDSPVGVSLRNMEVLRCVQLARACHVCVAGVVCVRGGVEVCSAGPCMPCVCCGCCVRTCCFCVFRVCGYPLFRLLFPLGGWPPFRYGPGSFFDEHVDRWVHTIACRERRTL